MFLLVFLYLTRLKARQILSRLIKYQRVFQKKVPNNIKFLESKQAKDHGENSLHEYQTTSDLPSFVQSPIG